VGAVKRVPAHVIGDGSSSIADLIEVKNTKRKRNPFLSSGLIKVDFEVNKCLEEQGLRLKDVPKRGAQVVLRRVANASAGGDVFDVTDQLPIEIKRAAIQAVTKLPGIVIAGVDVLYKTGQAATPDNYVIIEINSRPQIGVNMYPTSGRGRDVPLVIVDALFPGVRRLESQLVKMVRFNEKAIRAAFLSGVTSKMTVPSLPSHLFPFRSRFRYMAQGKPVELRPFSGQTLQKTARFYGVAGGITFTGSGDMELIVAAESRTAAQHLVRRVSELCSMDPTNEDSWEGPVTAGFIVAN
jgi:cyanophycin synthetase